MTAFRAVSHDDQIQLLKGGSIELLILRSVLTFDKDKQQFLDPLDSEETAAVKVTSCVTINLYIICLKLVCGFVCGQRIPWPVWLRARRRHPAECGSGAPD